MDGAVRRCHPFLILERKSMQQVLRRIRKLGCKRGGEQSATQAVEPVRPFPHSPKAALDPPPLFLALESLTRASVAVLPRDGDEAHLGRHGVEDFLVYGFVGGRNSGIRALAARPGPAHLSSARRQWLRRTIRAGRRLDPG